MEYSRYIGSRKNAPNNFRETVDNARVRLCICLGRICALHLYGIKHARLSVDTSSMKG
jgi:hypothetical protein